MAALRRDHHDGQRRLRNISYATLTVIGADPKRLKLIREQARDKLAWSTYQDFEEPQ
jgi:hypothetical protein